MDADQEDAELTPHGPPWEFRSVPLIALVIPTPDELRQRWAVDAALMAAIGRGAGCFAAQGRWHYDDGGGSWVDLVLLGDGRAVMFGCDRDYSDTYFPAGAAAVYGEPVTDLLAGAPPWWGACLPADDERLGFVYGFDGSTWQRAAYAREDGFASVGLPAMSLERILDLAEAMLEVHASATLTDDLEWVPDRAVLSRLAAGVGVTALDLAEVFGPVPADLEAGAAAAQLFVAVG